MSQSTAFNRPTRQSLTKDWLIPILMNQKGSGTRHCRAGQAGSSAVGRGGRRSPSTLRPVPHPAAREVRPAAPHQAEAGTTPTVWEGRTAGIPSPPPTRHSAGLQFPLRHSPGARAAQACSLRKPGREATVLWGKNLFGGDGRSSTAAWVPAPAGT